MSKGSFSSFRILDFFRHSSLAISHSTVTCWCEVLVILAQGSGVYHSYEDSTRAPATPTASELS